MDNMKQLTLLRHAKSSWKDPALADFDRPLNRRGREDAPRMGDRLREEGVFPDRVVASPALRARMTAEAIVAALGLGAERLSFCEAIYEADLERLMDLVRGLDDTDDHVLLVGHNPGLTDLWNHLSHTAVDNIPTCGVFSLRFSNASWGSLCQGSGQTVFTATPRRIEEAGPLEEKTMGKEKKKGCLHGKSEAKKKPGNYKCDKCGAVSAEEKHLCRPEKIKDKKKK